MARAIWSGAISFGLVNVPVQMYSAIAEHKLHFRLVHEPDQSPIGYQKVCKLEDKPVPDDEVVKAFEFEPGEYVSMEDEDFEAARVEGYKTIEITDFVPYDEIDPSTSPVLTTSVLGAEAKRCTACCSGRWSTPGSPGLRNSSCMTARTSVRFASATA
jgi:hypothetical protein